jgi:hypothetical protein
MCCLVPAIKSRLLLAIVMIKQVAIGSYKNQTSLLFSFSLLCGPWKNTVYLKCRHPHSLAQSSYIMSLDWTLENIFVIDVMKCRHLQFR